MVVLYSKLDRGANNKSMTTQCLVTVYQKGLFAEETKDTNLLLSGD